MLGDSGLPFCSDSRSGWAEVDGAIPDDLPKVTVGILEISRIDAHGRSCGGPVTAAPAALA